MPAEGPLVSVVLPTRDRPAFLAIALRCYQEQTYSHRELVVVDDGDRFPVDPALVGACGGRLIRLAPGTLLGEKLNVGLAAARGALCHKMDDDDYYAPAFLERLVAVTRSHQSVICRPMLAALLPFLFFDLARWEIRSSAPRSVSGAALLFARENWQAHPFRGLPLDEDTWFILDQTTAGAALVGVDAPELYAAVRHRGSANQRGHTWQANRAGERVEDRIRAFPPYRKDPAALFPAWAVAAYRALRAGHTVVSLGVPLGADGAVHPASQNGSAP